MPNPDRIIVLAPNWLGDAVMATPLLAAARRRLPGAEIVLACRAYVARVFKRNPAVDAVVEYRGRSVFARLASVRRASARPFDACFVLPPSFSAALASLGSRAPLRIGYGGQGRSLLLTDPLESSGYRTGHLSAAYVRLLERYSGTPEPDVPLPSVFPPPAWRGTARESVGEGGYFVLAPGATYGSSKVWPHERYAALAAMLMDRLNGKAVIVGRGEEREGARILAERIGSGARNLAGALSLEALIAVLRGASIAIGNDSGPVHIAAALGVPTIAVFGPTSVAWTAPRGPAVRIVREAIECAPCFKRECPFGSPRCLERIEVEDVLKGALSLVSEGSDAGERKPSSRGSES